MNRLAIIVFMALLGSVLLFCTREDGLPDAPLRQLVPCDRDAGSDDPLACPPASEDAESSEPADAGGDV